MLHLDSEQNQQTHYQQAACLSFYRNVIIETRNLGENSLCIISKNMLSISFLLGYLFHKTQSLRYSKMFHSACRKIYLRFALSWSWVRFVPFLSEGKMYNLIAPEKWPIFYFDFTIIPYNLEF